MDDFVPTLAARVRKDAEKSLVVANYESHKKSKSSVQPPKETRVRTNSDASLHSCDEDECGKQDKKMDDRRKQELEMKRYRYDVIKFGMSGFEKQKARKAKIALAISLGAVPPKNRRKNYKKVIEDRKREKVRAAKTDKFASGFNPNQLQKNKKKEYESNTKNKKSDGILDDYGKVTKQKKSGKTNKRKS